MPGWLKQSTAASVVFGPFVSASDGYSSKEAFTALSGIMFKNNASTLITGVAASHTASGMYKVDLASGSMDTLGRLKFHFANSASHLPVWDDYQVVVANTYDSLVSGTDRIAASLGASGIAASTFGGSAINAAAIAASAIARESIAATGARKIADVTLRREWGEAASSSDGDTLAFRSLLGAAAKMVNKIDASSGASLIVYRADDSTELGRQVITACNNASPIVTLDTT
jgi:hypothetical protein